MIGDKIVVDAVVHPYDLAPPNQVASAMQQLEADYAAHRMACDPIRAVADDEFSQARAQGIPAPWSALRGIAHPLPA
jgi:hypothetical protein